MSEDTVSQDPADLVEAIEDASLDLATSEDVAGEDDAGEIVGARCRDHKTSCPK